MKNAIEGTVLDEVIIGIPADQLEKHRNNLLLHGESYIRITGHVEKGASIATILKRKGATAESQQTA